MASSKTTDRPAQPQSPAKANAATLQSWSLSALFVLAAFAVLYIGRAVFIPIAFAVVLSFVFRPLVRGLRRAGVPAALGAAVVLASLTGAIGYGMVQLTEPASAWVQRMPKALRTVEHRVIRLRRPVQDVTKFADRVERMAQVDKSKPVREVTVDKPGLFESVVGAVRSFVSALVIMLITLYFMLVWGEALLDKLVALGPRSVRSTSMMGQVEQRMSRYMGTVALINTVLGAAVGVAMHLLEMPNPILWGVLAGVLNFVPYLGSLAGVVVVALASLLTFNDLGAAMLPPAAYFGITALEGNFVTPIIMGRTFRLSPLVIFVWLVIWTWLWGLSGALLAVPLLMLLKIVSDHNDRLAPLGNLLQR